MARQRLNTKAMQKITSMGNLITSPKYIAYYEKSEDNKPRISIDAHSGLAHLSVSLLATWVISIPEYTELLKYIKKYYPDAYESYFTKSKTTE